MWLHTHAADGIIHTESPVERTYTLGDFFDIWGQPLGRHQVGRHPIRRLRTVDRAEGWPTAVEIDQRLGVRPVDLQPFEHHRLRIVRSLHQLATTQRARLVRVTVAKRRVVTAAVANHPRTQPAHQLVLGHHHFDDDQRVAPGHQSVERDRLRHRPRKSVEDESALRVGASQPLTHDADHHFVADQLATVHDRLGPTPNLGSVVDRLAQDVAGRNLRDSPVASEALGLRALSRPRRAEHDEV